MPDKQLRSVCYIAPDVPLPYPSGASVHVSEVAQNLARIGHDVHVVSRRLDRGQPGIESMDGFTVHRVFRQIVRAGRKPSSGATLRRRPSAANKVYYTYLTTFFALYVAIVAARLIRRYKLEVIIERETAFGAGGLASIFSGRPMILEIVGPRYSRLSARRSSRILYYTESMLRKWVDRGKCVKVTSGVNLELFGKDDQRRTAVRNELGLSPEATVVGYVGTFQNWHGVDALLESAAFVSADRPDVRYLLVGPGHEPYDAIARSLSVQGLCTFTGTVAYERIPAIINACDIMVAPYDPAKDELRSKYGIGFPLKILEYMACSKPVIATQVAPIDTLMSGRDVGILVDPGHEDSLASAIRTLVDDPALRNQMGRRGRELVESKYGWSRFASEVSSIVESV